MQNTEIRGAGRGRQIGERRRRGVTPPYRAPSSTTVEVVPDSVQLLFCDAYKVWEFVRLDGPRGGEPSFTLFVNGHVGHVIRARA